MPRRPRQEGENAVHHVVAQGNRRRQIVVDDLDRYDLLRRLAACCSAFQWACSSYCLLDSHAHLTVRTSRPNLGDGMRRLLGDYAREFNRRHGLEGHVFRRPYYSVRILTEAHLFTSAIYVVMNPVVAGLCSHPSEWAWSSYTETALGSPGFVESDSLLRYFGYDDERARHAYRQSVDDAVSRIRRQG